MTATQQLDISILSAPLAAIDRRTLSQAWYSALHLAHAAAPCGPSASPATRTAQPHGLRALAAPHEARARTAPAPFPARAGAASSRVPVGAIAERRSPRTPVARRIERAVLERRGPSAPSSWAIGSGAGRAIVVVQNAGGRVRLIALCAPPAREAVARALEQARYALAGRGIALDATLAGEGPCT